MMAALALPLVALLLVACGFCPLHQAAAQSSHVSRDACQQEPCRGSLKPGESWLFTRITAPAALAPALDFQLTSSNAGVPLNLYCSMADTNPVPWPGNADFTSVGVVPTISSSTAAAEAGEAEADAVDGGDAVEGTAAPAGSAAGVSAGGDGNGADTPAASDASSTTQGFLVRREDYAGHFGGGASDPLFVCMVHYPATVAAIAAAAGSEAGASSSNVAAAAAAPEAVEFELEVKVYTMLYQDLYARCCNDDGACAPLASAVVAGDVLDVCSGVEGWECGEERQLLRLNLTGWGLSCPFPGDILSRYATLKALHLANNALTGTIDEVAASLAGKLPTLRELSLAGNPGINGALAADDDSSSVCQLAQSLTQLDVSGAGLSGPLPACLFAEGSALGELRASRCGLSGPLPEAAFGNASQLRVLDISHNAIDGTLPARLALLTLLEELDASFNALSGGLPEFGDAGTPRLATLALAGNQLTGAVPSSLAEHPSLVMLDLEGNALDALPAQWLDASLLPAEPSNSSLVYLHLGGNQLQGSFPSGLALLPSLAFLLLNGNQLEGTLPELPGGGFQALRVLDASANWLSGEIGASWGQLGMFSEPPPADVGSLFNLSYNALSGDLPALLSKASLEGLEWPVAVALQGNAFANGCAKEFELLEGVCGSGAAAGVAAESSGSGDGSGGHAGPSVSDGSTTASSWSIGRSSSIGAGAIAGVVLALAVTAVVAGGVIYWRRRRAAADAAAAGEQLLATRFKKFSDIEDFAHPAGGALELSHVDLGPPPLQQRGEAHGAVGSGHQSYRYYQASPTQV